MIRCLDKMGYPVETIKGRWFFNLLRRLIHTRKLETESAYRVKEYKKAIERIKKSTFPIEQISAAFFNYDIDLDDGAQDDFWTKRKELWALFEEYLMTNNEHYVKPDLTTDSAPEVPVPEELSKGYEKV